MCYNVSILATNQYLRCVVPHSLIGETLTPEIMAKTTKILVQEGNSPQSEGDFLKEKLSSTTKVADMIQQEAAPKAEPAEADTKQLDELTKRLEALESTIAEKDAAIQQLETEKVQLLF